MAGSVFGSVASSPIFKAVYPVAGAIAITWGNSQSGQDSQKTAPAGGGGTPSTLAYDFLLQSIAIDQPERVQVTTGFSDSVQAYTFGAGVKTCNFQGLIVYGTQTQGKKLTDLFKDWESKLRARAAALKGEASITISMDGTVIKLLPVSITFSRNQPTEATCQVGINGIILSMNQSSGGGSPAPRSVITPG